jgi:(2Fe-2S) ferredoxin
LTRSDRSKPYFEHHVFFCCNQRSDGRESCNDKGAIRLRDYAKQRAKALKLSGPRKARINMAGCLDRCASGPVMVVYPEGVWYTYSDEKDVDEILNEHVANGRIVERLRIRT